MSENAVEIKNVSMMFNKSSERIDNIKEYIVRLAKRNIMFEEFWALKDVSFNIKKGEAIGIVGLNGSGKSTLLKIIAQVMKPTKGSVTINGSIAPLIELGAGFDMDLSARENVFLNGAVLGYSRAEMKKKFEDIMDFAELWDFVDVAVKNYSSGMIARLGFAIATAHTPDILIVDEILGVGDYKFQEKCEKRMNEIISHGATIIFVSHSIKQVRELCTRAVWIEKGNVVMIGDVEEVCDKYMV
ncbi:ABC transporter ATP-binding protein [Clostridium beijerinckii]|uniref:Teichoic acid ABC transporter ATP-binding protein n=1 Tax=Clostridium beijerinckii TaxID=1520 RepID=A0A1S9NB68_CLOBE|nr:ABC transporter ATP-binding protein [Clostridium beijerinckii]OOP74784.1 teichoic acid ABC transporter ATP-binding protein [Clostridium beijerinckii]